MSLEVTLKHIENDIQSGDYGKARDRLNSLVLAYPNNLEFRRKLGEVYWKLQFPEMAGRFWYLEERKTPEISTACEIFERRFGNKPSLILQALKFKGDIEKLESEYAREKLHFLLSKVTITKGIGKSELYEDKPTLKDRIDQIGCFFGVGLVIFIFILGVWRFFELVF